MMNVLNRIAPLPAQKLLLGISLFFWCGAMHLYWPNNGGSGLSLPLNITSWIYAVVLAASALMLAPRQRWRITVPAAGFTIGAFILMLLCLLTPDVRQAEALLVAGALLGGVSVYLVTLQIPLTANTLTALLALLWGACVIECLVFVYQYWHLPGVDYWEFAWRRGTRPYGIFQQVNLLASFTACGVLLSATLFLRLRDGYRIVIGVGLVMMGFVLHESQSQTGYLSLVVGEVLLLAVFPAQRRTLLLLLPLASGMAAGSLVRHFLSVATVDHFTTSQVRWTVLKTSLALFAERPWTGWGVGSFAAVFLERAGPLGLSSISHPHNELVLWLVEGGLVGLVGALCFIASGFWLWMHGNRWRRACLVAALPVVIHMLTEYPVRQSTPHWLLLILLLRCADSDRAGIRLVLTSTWLIRAPGVISLLTVAPLLLLTLHTQQQLTLAERQSSQWHLAESLPVGGWLLTSRYRFDVQMGYLQRYQRTRDAHWLEAVRRWAPDYVRVHPDPNVSFTQILLALQQRDLVEAHRLATRFCLIYPNDRRIPWLQDARRPFNKIME
ncbi:TPA: O-antigen ligase family protein [Citrobacter freundii]|nr:O-antigen ligase family protein [Citrobacter freundii]HBZ8715237.1 O-antigen ligase family protein [Citrobacter freundii]HCA2682739.1 O-antigen ligase family protein [Citrobacter freundii]HCA2683612.1 O-antigen ligase family protein [Citrobacter freundii]